MKNIFLLSLFSFFISCKEKKHDLEKIKGWETFETINFSFQYPNNWKLDTSKAKSGVVQVISATGENVLLTVQSLIGKSITPDKYVDISIKQLDTIYSNFKLTLEVEKVGISGKYKEIICTGDQDNYHLKFKSDMWFYNSMAYALIYTASQNSFNTHGDTATKIMDSFYLRKKYN